MAIYIRQHPTIQGLQLGEETVKITQFVDDSTCVLKSLASLPPLLSFLGTFASWSGLNINKAKSMILLPNEALSGIRALHGIPVVDKVKILGVWFTGQCSTEDHYLLNFKPQLSKIRGVCESWNARNLSIKGKVTLVNSLMISLLQYQCSLFFTPPQVFRDYRKFVTDFIWNGRKAKVAYATIILPVAQGGLNVMDLETRVMVSTLQWIRRFIKRPESNTALSLAHILRVKSLAPLLASKLGKVPKEVRNVPFYSSLFELWNKNHAFSPSEEGAIRRELIWNNKFITSEGVGFYWKAWESKGISRIMDICQPGEGRLCSHVELQERYNIHCSFLDALRLRLSIPGAWRQALTRDWREPPLPPSLSGVEILLPGEAPTDILAASSKLMYRALILQSKHQSTAFQRWSEPESQPLQILSKEEWMEANLTAYRSTRETKLQSLHFRIMNRILPCNKFLRQIRIKDSDACQLCGQSDSLLHFLFECQAVRDFWAAVCVWFSRVEDLALDTLSPKLYVFGVPRTFKKAAVVNFILMNTKFFTYRQRLFHGGKLELLHWLREFKMKLLMERHISRMEGKPQRFRKWTAILDAIG